MKSIRFDDDEDDQRFEATRGESPDPGGGAPGGNRPAEGARQATPGQVFQQEGEPRTEQAEDFLDLANEAPELVQVRLDGADGDVPDTPAWLMADPAEPVPEPSFDLVGDGVDSGHTSEAEDEDSLELDGAIVADVEPGLADEFEGDGFDDEPEPQEAPEEEAWQEELPVRGGRQLLVRGTLLVVLSAGLGAAATVGRHLLDSRGVEPGPEVARVMEVAPREPGPTPGAPEVAGPAQAPLVPLARSVPAAVPEPLADPAPPVVETASEAAATPVGDGAPGLVPGEVHGPVPPALPVTSPVMDLAADIADPEGAAPAGTVPDSGTIAPNISPVPGAVASFASDGTLEFLAGTANVSVVWQTQEVPLHALDQPVAWLTPAVGNVRVEIDTDERFEGRLYSLGGGGVVLDTALGRIRLDGARVRSVERVLKEGALGPGADPEALPGERVRARTPGGWIVGRVLSRNADRVTLLTDSGGRITLVDPQLQPLAKDTTIVGLD